MKRNIVTLALALIVPLMGNLQYLTRNRLEITLLAPAVMIGVDKPEETGGKPVNVSLLIEKAGSFEGAAGGDSPEESASGKLPVSAGGETVSLAIEEAQKKSVRKISAGSIEIFLLGEEAVKSDLRRYVDFLSRDNELRLTADTYFVRGASAEDMIKAVNEKNSFDIFRVSANNIEGPAGSDGIKFIDFLASFCEKGSAFAVPTAVLSGEGEVSLGGYAIITGGNLSGYIEPELARGYNFLTNQQSRSVIELPDENGGKAAMIIENMKSRVDFVFDGEQLEKIVVRTIVSTDAQDAGGFRDIRDPGTIGHIQREQAAILDAEMVAVMELCREYKSDFLGLGQKLRMKHPYKWDRMKDNWPDILAEVPVEFRTETHLRRSFEIIEL